MLKGTFYTVNEDHSVPLRKRITHLLGTMPTQDFPVTACKGRGVGKHPMLCSGSTMGSRDGMLAYFAAMDTEFRAWISDPKCRFDLVGCRVGLGLAWHALAWGNWVTACVQWARLWLISIVKSRLYNQDQ